MNGGAIFFADVEHALLRLAGNEFHELRGDGYLPHATVPGVVSLRETD